MAPPENPPDGPSPFGVGLRLLGAIAGIGAVMSFVGGAMLWLRFDALRLPADQAVTLLPKQLLLVVGAHAMAVPVGLGVFAAILFVLANALDPDANRRHVRWILLVAIAAPSAVAAYLLVVDYDVWPHELVVLAAVAAGGVVLWIAVAELSHRHTLPWIVLGVWTLCGAVVAVMRTYGQPTMEPVAVVLDGTPNGVGGFYIGQTADRLYVAPLPGSGDPGDPFADADVDRILEINREKVLQMALRGPTGLANDEAGREQAQTLLEDLRVLVSGTPSPETQTVITQDPVTAFAPLVHLHSREKLMPMSASAFLRNSWLAWAHDKGCDDWVPGGPHEKNPSDDHTTLGRFDHNRLAGPAAYEHVTADNDCGEADGPAFRTTDHTRPFDTRHRPRGLDAREGFYLDLDDVRRKGTGTVKTEGPQTVLKPMPVYYERMADKVDGVPAQRITYWTFYGLSEPPGADAGTRFLVHEGDWERISVLIKPGANAGEYLPVSVRYHAHDGSRDVAWAAVKRVGTGGSNDSTHPVVYSAVGSHASYWRAGRYENVFYLNGKRQFAVFDDARACSKCPHWRTWESLLDTRLQRWYGFGGAWGDVGSNTGFTGPLGPSRYKAEGLSPAPEATVRRAPAPVATPAAGAATTGTAAPTPTP
jgi:hypothetical protein